MTNLLTVSGLRARSAGVIDGAELGVLDAGPGDEQMAVLAPAGAPFATARRV
jgi:hypothetical protein